jgi:hypothetical protein
MITTCLQSFTHRCQARLSPSGGLLVQCTPRQPLLAGSCEKFFRVFELNVVGMVDVKNVVMEILPPIGDEGTFRLFWCEPLYLLRRRGEQRRNEALGVLDYFGTNPVTFMVRG